MTRSSLDALRGPCFVLVATAIGGASCATTGAPGAGDENLPSAGVGPFRKLTAYEVPGTAPFVLDDRAAQYREPAVLDDVDGGVILYVVAHRDDVDVIVRSRSADGRAFYGGSGDFGHVPPVVLAPEAPWEGHALSGPFAIRRAGEVLLYYAAAGGIGVARSFDGIAFQKEPGPIFVRDPSSPWETTPPSAPAIYVLPDGRVRMLYASGSSIFEAASDDGLRFTRIDPDLRTPLVEPVLAPTPNATRGPTQSVGPNAIGQRPPFDTSAVGHPHVSARVTAAGRFHVRVLYTGIDEAGASAIGYAGRYGGDGFLERQAMPVYAVSAKEAAPALVEVRGGTLLYIEQERRTDRDSAYKSIAAAFAPGDVELPVPAPFPASP